MKVSVIMPSFLNIPGKTDQGPKFIRAVKSFLNQTYQDKELIIVSDGCPLTIELCYKHFKDYKNIKLLSIEKQPPYSGEMRNIAFNEAEGDIITYLDSDDVIGKNHIQTIVDQFDLNEIDFVYYDDYMTLDKEFKKLHIREVLPRWGSIGTSSISHKNPKNIKDGNKIKWSLGYGHDFLFALLLSGLGLKFKKLEKMPQYIVAHYKDGDF